MGFSQILAYLLPVISASMATAVTVHAVLKKRDVRAVIGWVGLAWLSPIVGAILYLFFGINRIDRKAADLVRMHEVEPEINQLDLSELARFQDSHPSLKSLEAAGQAITGLHVLPGNRVEPLVNGDQAFPAMLKAISEAKRSIALLSYIFDSDRIGDKFFDALVSATQRGVEVRVLIDAVGSGYGRSNMVKRLRRAGVNAAGFLPTKLPRPPTYANLRNHRKILVIDGIHGFTGGTNIREGHCLELKPRYPAQCLHFQLSGPIVRHLLHVFVVDWEFTTGERLTGEAWSGVPHREGSVWARGVEDGPDSQFEKLIDLMSAGLACARDRVRIFTPYFLPNASLVRALNVTAMRGVSVEIYLPLKNNIRILHWASTAQLWQNLSKGCRVFYTTGPFDHTKLMIVDDVWSLIGSTNWDARSLRLNFEFNVECYSLELAQQLNRIADFKAENAKEITLQDITSRSFPVRLRDGLARLMSPYL